MADPFQVGYSRGWEDEELVSPGGDVWDQGLDVAKAMDVTKVWMWLDYGCGWIIDVT